MSETRLPIHPYAELVPAITSPEFEALCGAIARQGLLEEPAVTSAEDMAGSRPECVTREKG